MSEEEENKSKGKSLNSLIPFLMGANMFSEELRAFDEAMRPREWKTPEGGRAMVVEEKTSRRAQRRDAGKSKGSRKSRKQRKSKKK